MIAADSMYTYASYRYRSVNVERFMDQVNIGHTFPATGRTTFELTLQEIVDIATDVSIINFALYDENMELTDEDRCVRLNIKCDFI